MADHSPRPGATASTPARRLIAAGFIRRLPGRTLTVRATEVGVTGRITPAMSGGPVCCGHPMRAEGGLWVCDHCGASYDVGATSRAARIAEQHRLARADYEQAADTRASWAAQDHSDLFLAAEAAQAVNGR